MASGYICELFCSLVHRWKPSLAQAVACLLTFACARALLAMLGRLQWLRQQIAAGKHISVHFTYNAQESKDKVRFVIDGNAGDRLQDSLFLVAALDLVTAAVSKSVTVDRGHRFSSGRSEVCFWLQHPENVPSPCGTSGYSKISKMTRKEMEVALKEALRQDPALARPAAPVPPLEVLNMPIPAFATPAKAVERLEAKIVEIDSQIDGLLSARGLPSGRGAQSQDSGDGSAAGAWIAGSIFDGTRAAAATGTDAIGLRPMASSFAGLPSGQREPSRPSSASTQTAPAHWPLLAGSDPELKEKLRRRLNLLEDSRHKGRFR